MKEKMKALLYKFYIVMVLLVMAVPFVMFFFCPSATSTENRKLADFPSTYADNGEINMNYLKDMAAYFEDRFAFRNELVDLNSHLKADVFNVSPEDDVIVGENGWLYYASTLDDYRGDDLSNARELYSIARNIKLIQDYCEGLDTKFVFTIAPNKNSLYGENMPFSLSKKISDTSDAKMLKPYLESVSANYLDLFDLFKSQDEVLYLKRDSHWNKKGAVLAYNAMLDAVNFEHDDYSSVSANFVDGTVGDLNKMIYPMTPQSEGDFVYDKKYTFKHEDGTEFDVTNSEINTSCENGKGNLVMYRDSFGNSLIDLFSEEFANSYFSKLEPYNLSDIEEKNADVLILEKVERHIQSLYKVAPVMRAQKKAGLRSDAYRLAYSAKNIKYSEDKNLEAPIADLKEEGVRQIVSELINEPNGLLDSISSNIVSISCNSDVKYLEVTGTVDKDCLSDDSRIFLIASDGPELGVYEAFLLGENQFTAYFDTDNENMGIAVLVVSDDGKTASMMRCGEYTDNLKSDVAAVIEEAKNAAVEEKARIEAEKRAREEAERKRREEEERKKREEEERLRREKLEAERKAKENAKKNAAKKNSSKTSGKTIVRKTFYEDCGSDSGYYEIVWSDGSVTYKDVR